MKRMKKLAMIGVFSLAIIPTEIVKATAITSDGEATFVPTQDVISTIKPGTDDTITIQGSSNNTVTVSDVHLLHVPDFKFGKNETSVMSKDYNVLYEQYKKIGSEDIYTIPQFIQVADMSGKQGTKWKVTVEQADLFTESGGHKLKNSRIKINNQTLINNVNQTNVSNLISGIALTETDSITIPIKDKDSGALSVITSKGGETDNTTTNGTISSVVLKDAYKESDYGKENSPHLIDRNDDVFLSVPKSDGVQAKVYKTTLNWDLTIEP
ncbi:WxL domain-containing protein [Enterococcus rivorum]|uniref:WxL domain-containing protein n=1 Tax=Enterococcus rivorum TaxID=762845 RepID=A0A1E5KWR4_9ENTE|nr:WxL domain-containing protein [Enterococcus rivorum]MBP2097343.1 hypothetical protein [Enterococcus rivorum]OEH82311.1 hypothetical protein BCR26_02440 [Enterococcus rivorum]